MRLAKFNAATGFEDTGFEDAGFEDAGFEDTGFEDTGFEDTAVQQSLPRVLNATQAVSFAAVT